MRIELTRVAPYAPQTYASTNSATRAVPKYSSKNDDNFNNLFMFLFFRSFIKNIFSSEIVKNQADESFYNKTYRIRPENCR